jgi:hypothetical protein
MGTEVCPFTMCFHLIIMLKQLYELLNIWTLKVIEFVYQNCVIQTSFINIYSNFILRRHSYLYLMQFNNLFFSNLIFKNILIFVRILCNVSYHMTFNVFFYSFIFPLIFKMTSVSVQCPFWKNLPPVFIMSLYPFMVLRVDVRDVKVFSLAFRHKIFLHNDLFHMCKGNQNNWRTWHSFYTHMAFLHCEPLCVFTWTGKLKALAFSCFHRIFLKWKSFHEFERN